MFKLPILRSALNTPLPEQTEQRAHLLLSLLSRAPSRERCQHGDQKPAAHPGPPPAPWPAPERRRSPRRHSSRTSQASLSAVPASRAEHDEPSHEARLASPVTARQSAPTAHGNIPLVPGGKFWFSCKTAAKKFTVKHQPNCFAGTITQVTNQLMHWRWDYDSSSCTNTRSYELLLKQKPQVVTEAQQRYLDVQVILPTRWPISPFLPPMDTSPLIQLMGVHHRCTIPSWVSRTRGIQLIGTQYSVGSNLTLIPLSS
jgi:hypothetical protein